MFLVVYKDTNCDCMERETVCGVYSTHEKANAAIVEASLYFESYVQLHIIDVVACVDKPISRYHNYPTNPRGWYPNDLT